MSGSKIFLLWFSLFLFSCTERENSETTLQFQDGKFRIVQFTDIHFQYDSYRSDSALVLMKKVIESEKPDLVMLTGDIVCSRNTRNAWLKLTDVLVDAGVPWGVTFGNHDPEYELTKEEIIETIEGLPNNLTVNGPSEIAGNGNYILEIKSEGSDMTAALLYCFDSHSSFEPETDLGTYEWIEFSQIAWYREQSRKYSTLNGGKPLPSLAFFHIPLPEYNEIAGREGTIGIYEESVCCPDLNSGMYTSMLECGDVMGMFTGHDHDNNFIGSLRKICMAYGYASGRQSYGSIGRGARVIDLYEGKRHFDTYVIKMYECDRDKDIWQPAEDRSPQFFVTFRDSVLTEASH
ncbi:MAG TPA: metallophosphoesterase family protein [Bacteroidales bacterium]|nr:metallophosphoesterase family protein [Bacteroidales bacterium]